MACCATPAGSSWRPPRAAWILSRSGATLAAEEGVVEVHDLHVWEVTSGMPAISAHMVVGRDVDCHEARWHAARLLADRFGVEHSTLQVEHEPGDELLQISSE